MTNENAKLRNLRKHLEGAVVFLASADKRGSPNIITAEVNKVTDDWEIVITNNQMFTTIKNLLATKKAAILFSDHKKIWWRILGDVKYDLKGKWLKFVQSLPNNKGYDVKGAVIIKIKKIDDLDVGKTILTF